MRLVRSEEIGGLPGCCVLVKVHFLATNVRCHLSNVSGAAMVVTSCSRAPSGLPWHLAAREHWPTWIRTDRLLGTHGIQEDTACGRQQLERRMEARLSAESEEGDWEPLRSGWCLGSEQFKKEMLERIETRLGEHHSGELRRESAEGKVERIIAVELKRLGWTITDLPLRRKSDPGKLQMVSRIRSETTLSVKWIAQRLHMGSWKSATTRLHDWKKGATKP